MPFEALLHYLRLPLGRKYTRSAMLQHLPKFHSDVIRVFVLVITVGVLMAMVGIFE